MAGRSPLRPTANLCSAGTVTGLTNVARALSWSCSGQDGGTTASCSATVTPARPATRSPRGLVSWWKGDDDATDHMGNNNGTLENGAGFALGEVNDAFSFNGSNQYVLIGQPVPADLQIQNNITLSAWAITNLTPKARLAYRLSNTDQPHSRLIRNPRAIVLENALLDTTQPLNLAIPASLRAHGDPGTYGGKARWMMPFGRCSRRRGEHRLLHSQQRLPGPCLRSGRPAVGSGPGDRGRGALRALLQAQGLAAQGGDGADPLARGRHLRLLVFPDARDETLNQLGQLGMQVLSEQPSTFGPIIEVAPPQAQPSAGQGVLPELAQLAGVHEVELARRRVPANDLSRATTGVAADSVTLTNYLNLSGSNVLVALADSGVDATHPDLVNRVLADSTNSVVDTSGHGTHVAGIIAGDGTESMTVTNAQGSVMPATNGQFRGKAPGAKLFSMTAGSDYYLQQTAARTNAFISNNSWTYGNNEYDLAAASYDAAVRDALPDVPGSQPVLFVFATGNNGTINVYDDGSDDNGQGGSADTVFSPGTAKNVITVGAIEQLRNITNQVSVCLADPTSTNGVDCSTNQPWLLSSDSGTADVGFQVAKGSGLGNVGLFVEGDSGRFKPDVVAPGDVCAVNAFEPVEPGGVPTTRPATCRASSPTRSRTPAARTCGLTPSMSPPPRSRSQSR